MRLRWVALLLVGACHRAPADDVAIAGTGGTPAEVAARDAAFDEVLATIEAKRAALSKAFAAARTEPDRAAIRAEARAFLLAAIRDDLFPAWIGTPWAMGKDSDAVRPHQAGKSVSCSYFITAILGNAGVQLDSRKRFARAAALDIQRSLSPDPASIHRYLSVPARELERKVAALGDDLYLIGLSNHVAFVDVTGGDVRLVHSSWSGGEVDDEPFVTAHAIDVSRKAGYFVSPVLTPLVVDTWLRGAKVRFRGTGAKL